jgi:methyltransferase (TIGR00027 family)
MAAQTENDTWDPASSVGATATTVAPARAVATRDANPLINDPLAEPLVRAVGIDFCSRMAGGELDPTDIDADTGQGVQRIVDVMAVRTRYFDEFFTRAAEAGIRQAVILASALDSRAYRLPWPTGTTVFEIDQPEVIEFKTATLAGLDATLTANRRVVAIDLRQDWPAALRQADFDTDRPTAWIAEGLLGHLPPDARHRLLDNITLSPLPANYGSLGPLGGVNLSASPPTDARTHWRRSDPHDDPAAWHRLRLGRPRHTVRPRRQRIHLAPALRPGPGPRSAGRQLRGRPPATQHINLGVVSAARGR